MIYLTSIARMEMRRQIYSDESIELLGITKDR